MESRREFLQAVAATTAVGLAGASSTTGAGATAPQPQHPPEPREGRLKDFWNRDVKDLVTLPALNLTPAEAERHLIYCGLLSALLAHYWNGNKRGKNGTYPWREKQKLPNGQYQGGDYLGHNIACLAVDGEGRVIDFDFNHNEIFSSSVEHAESRLVRRIFSLAQLYDGWAMRRAVPPTTATSYSNLLNNVTVYTTLESCSQCSGIMALGSVKEVVFLHRDPSQNSIGNILRQLSPEKSDFKAPLPIPADTVGFGYFTKLSDSYDEFAREVANKPFFIPSAGSPDKSASITSFLCTDAVLDIFSTARKDFEAKVAANFPSHVPTNSGGVPIPKALTNQEVLDLAHVFFVYASTEGKRGTPHQL